MKHGVYVYETWKISRSHNHKGTVTVWHVFSNKDSYTASRISEMDDCDWARS